MHSGKPIRLQLQLQLKLIMTGSTDSSSSKCNNSRSNKSSSLHISTRACQGWFFERLGIGVISALTILSSWLVHRYFQNSPQSNGSAAPSKQDSLKARASQFLASSKQSKCPQRSNRWTCLLIGFSEPMYIAVKSQPPPSPAFSSANEKEEEKVAPKKQTGWPDSLK
jgi:hypothetical protein